MTPRLLVYVQPHSFISVLLLQAVLEHVAQRSDGVIAGVVDAAPAAPGRSAGTVARILAATAVKRLAGAGRRAFFHPDMLRDARRVARRHGLPVLVPPGRDVNHPAHVAEVRELRPQYALSLGCLQVFGGELLESFDGALNYHNGRLPEYRGLAATAWSLYHREPTSGFCYHLMERGVDTGAVLLEGAVAVPAGASAMEVEHRKTKAAARELPAAVERLLAGDAGTPQRPGGRFFSRARLARVRRLERGERVELEELERRLAAFDLVWITAGDRTYPVTGIAAVGPGARRGCPVIETSDGVTVMLRRCCYLPTAVFLGLRRLGLAGPAWGDPGA